MILALIRVISAFPSGLSQTSVVHYEMYPVCLSMKLEFITKEDVWLKDQHAFLHFFFVFKNLAQTHILNELMCEMKEKGTKLKICHTSDSQLVSMQ